MHCIWIICQDNTPFAPGTSMAFIDDDVTEKVWGVILSPKPWLIIFLSNIKRLIGSNQNSGIPLRILGGNNLCIITENGV